MYKDNTIILIYQIVYKNIICFHKNVVFLYKLVIMHKIYIQSLPNTWAIIICTKEGEVMDVSAGKTSYIDNSSTTLLAALQALDWVYKGGTVKKVREKGLSTIICTNSPYLYNTYNKDWGVDKDNLLLWRKLMVYKYGGVDVTIEKDNFDNSIMSKCKELCNKYSKINN